MAAVERSRAGPSWRASLGVIVTAIAAVLLVFAVWQTFWLSREAGADVAALSRERVAVQFEGLIFPLLLDLQNYRLQVELTHNPSPAQHLQSRIDKEIWRSTAFVRDHDAQLAIQSHWNGIETSWSKARTIRPGYSGPLLDSMEEALRMDVVYRVEDTSGLQYETNRYAQDLGDMLFAKLPSTLDEVGRGNLLTQNAQTQGTILIPNRIHLAGLVAAMSPDGGDFDLNMDDWGTIVKRIPQHNLGTAAQAARYQADDAAFALAGGRLAASEKSNVVERDRPRGNPAATQALANSANASILHMHADLSELLDRLLVVRTGYELARNRYVYGIVLLGAMLLVGIMLLVSELTAMRDRNAFVKVQRETERLTAQLAREHAERALRLSEAQFRAVFDGAALGIAIVDRNGALIEANAVFRSIYGENASGVLDEHQPEFSELMRGDRDLFEFEQHVMTPAGHEAWTDSTVSLVTDEAGNPYFAICMFRDLTEFKRNERRIQHDMTHDALTGLPNRGFFDRNIDEQFQQLKASPESSFAVLFVDLDRFKDINESLGHASGDFVISQAARRLRSAIGSADTVARLGSDEFAILLHSLTDVLHVEVIARNVLSALAKPVALGDRSIFLSASVGIALANSAYEHGEDVMRDAEIAMRYAKASGGGRFSIFDSKMHARAEKRLQLDDRPAFGARKRRVRPAVSADCTDRRRRIDRMRGITAVESSGGRRDGARRLHAARGANRPRRSHRKVRLAHRLPPGGALEARYGRPRSVPHQRQRLGYGTARSRFRDRAARCGSRIWRRSVSADARDN